MAHGSSITRVDKRVSLYEDDPTLALVGTRPHIVDEWQDVPPIWNVVRHATDDGGNAPGQFLLTCPVMSSRSLLGLSGSICRGGWPALANRAATPTTLATIAPDATSGTGRAPTDETVSSYLAEFGRNYFLEALPGWDAQVRAKSQLRTKPKRYLADPPLWLGC